MPFTGNESHDISLEEACLLTQAYRESAPAGATRAVYFSKAAILKVLDQPDCVGLRIYNAIKDGNHTFVIVGASAEQEDLEEGIILEFGIPCPPICPMASALNGTA